MKECDNSTRKIHISSKFILSISLLIMFDTLLLRPSLHCNTPPHFTTLHPTTLHYTSLHFTTLNPTTLHYTSLLFTTLHYTSPNYTSLHLTQLHFATLHHTSPNYTSLHFATHHPTTHHYTSLHFTTLHPTTLHYTYRHFTSSRLHFITLSFSFTQLRNYISGVLYWTGCVMAERQSLVLVLQWWSWHNGSCFEILRDYPSQSSLHDCPTPIQQRSLQFQMTLTYSVLVTP